MNPNDVYDITIKATVDARAMHNSSSSPVATGSIKGIVPTSDGLRLTIQREGGEPIVILLEYVREVGARVRDFLEEAR